jgi:hypothetical protein
MKMVTAVDIIRLISEKCVWQVRKEQAEIEEQKKRSLSHKTLWKMLSFADCCSPKNET